MGGSQGNQVTLCTTVLNLTMSFSDVPHVQVYEAVSCMSQRQLKRAANLLLDSVATFTTYELFSYEQCVFYAVSMAIVTLPRPDLRKKVRFSPHPRAMVPTT